MTPRLGLGSVIAIWGASAAQRQALADVLARRINQCGVPAMSLAAGAAASTLASHPARADLTALAHHWRLRIDIARQRALVVASQSPVGLLAEGAVPADDWPAALVSAERGHAFTLLLAPSNADSRASRAVDYQLRAAFITAGLSCTIIHGHDDVQRLARAWSALRSGLDAPDETSTPPRRLGVAAWNCERCSDPDCEHRLFTDLLAARQTPATG
ncbi:hypothetical protein [Pseudacidovorax sp. RU35E]|uniref:hypothetical protein n=1 Tax=Pseudacidovorax sp. RU35E TaxID=1907403 RepID=UPI0009562AFB|nr:hypothetical protein [Pseudacidovorax sp. RU35E]SIP94881.1 hypothetical protein SAMN05880557_101249 [Pseudacidovorax sp. RU35E]